MSLIVRLVSCTILVILVKADDAPDCGIRNQFRGYCFSFDYCTSFGCTSEKCGYFPRHSEMLKIQQTKIIPQCASTNSSTLIHITGIDSNIRVLASGSFANLPNLESILLPFNLIRELHHGIFYNVQVPLIDLSWNKIIYISEGAFNGVSGLKYLNLSRNELSTLPVENIPRSIVQINLSYNFLERIALNGAKRPELTSVDLSYNNLKNVALSFDNTLEELDLTHNHLKNIDFYDVNDCKNLKIPSNLFSAVPQFLEYSRIRRVAIHPNPWKCDELKRLWVHLQNNNIEEETPTATDSQPLCSLTSDLVRSRLQNIDLECEDDKHCAKNMLCRAHKCWNPCNSVCERTNICTVSDHKIECTCPDKQKKNPQELFSPCYDVECFSDTDCKLDNVCGRNKTCAPLPSISNFESLAFGGGYGGSYGQASYNPTTDNASTGYYGGYPSLQFGSFGSYGNASNWFSNNSAAGNASNGYGAFYPGAASSQFGSSEGDGSGAYGAGNGSWSIRFPYGPGSDDSRPTYGAPWWFEEIPKFTPSKVTTQN